VRNDLRNFAKFTKFREFRWSAKFLSNRQLLLGRLSLSPLLSLLEVLRQNNRERRRPMRGIAVGRVLVDRRRRLRGAIVVVVWRILDLLLIAHDLLSLSVKFLLVCKNRNLPNSLLISASQSDYQKRKKDRKQIISRQAVT
jgi:hypothetical protein